MSRLLVINPNTSESISLLVNRHVQAATGPDVEVQTVTARFGAPYIACEASYAVAGHATLDAWAAAVPPGQPGPDAVLIACFGDPGLFALRETSLVPVTGLAQAAFEEASALGRFAVVTGGARWEPMLQRLAHALGVGQDLAGIQTVALTGAQIAADPQAAQSLLIDACRDAAQKFSAQAIVLGGAGLAGLVEHIAPHVPVPVIDSVQAGTRQALRLSAPVHPAAIGRFDVAWYKVSAELSAAGRT
jgi:Asp/Glu/hydantoin racemase